MCPRPRSDTGAPAIDLAGHRSSTCRDLDDQIERSGLPQKLEGFPAIVLACWQTLGRSRSKARVVQTQLAASNSAAVTLSRTGQILKKITAVRAPVVAVSTATARSMMAEVR